MRQLQPHFVLVGSASEGTRIGLANEMDVLIKFKAFDDRKAPLKVMGGSYLGSNNTETGGLMGMYFEGEKFDFNFFKKALLDTVRESMETMFNDGMNPPELKIIVNNEDWVSGRCLTSGKCKKLKEEASGALFEHCENCAVTVCQTKPGVALQFQWMQPKGHSIYTSIDLIPVFPIEPIAVMDLVRMVNTFMIGPEHPIGWLAYLRSYWKHYKEIRAGAEKINAVVLKTMNNQPGNNYYVRPSLPCTGEPFKNERTKIMYSYIKYFKKVLDLDISSYFVKNELNKDNYQSIMESCITNMTKTGDVGWKLALMTILSQPDFESKIGEKIDLEESIRKGHFCLPKGGNGQLNPV